jgi:hypothetical protein
MSVGCMFSREPGEACVAETPTRPWFRLNASPAPVEPNVWRSDPTTTLGKVTVMSTLVSDTFCPLGKAALGDDPSMLTWMVTTGGGLPAFSVTWHPSVMDCGVAPAEGVPTITAARHANQAKA